MTNWSQMVLKGVNCVHNNKIRSNGLERSQLEHTIKKSCQMVSKEVNWVHNTKIRLYGREMSQLCTQ